MTLTLLDKKVARILEKGSIHGTCRAVAKASGSGLDPHCKGPVSPLLCRKLWGSASILQNWRASSIGNLLLCSPSLKCIPLKELSRAGDCVAPIWNCCGVVHFQPHMMGVVCSPS